MTIRLDRLRPRERQVLESLRVTGSLKVTAENLGLAVGTVRETMKWVKRLLGFSGMHWRQALDAIEEAIE